MEPKAHHVMIGLFTLIAFGAALAFALWLGKSSADRDWAYYQIEFEQAVSGLSEGNPVLYSGVQVGDVLELKLVPEDPSHVRVLVRIDRSIPIRESTRAGLILANITGSMNVQLSGGSQSSPILEGNRNNPPRIPAEPSAFNSLLTNGEELMTKANRLLTNANRAFSEQNTENMASVLENTRAATEALLASREQFSDLLARLEAAGARAEQAAAKVSRTSDTANALLQNEGHSALQAMENALGSIQSTSSRIDQLTRENEGAIGAGLQGLGELAPALRELRSTLRSLNHFTRRLEEDPRGTLLGGETIKELSQ